MMRPLLAALLAILLSASAARAQDREPAAPSATAGPIATTTTASGPGLRFEVFAMGQADSMLIVGPQRSVLVDCGVPIDGAKDGYKHVAREIERLCGRKHVDDLVITHFHSDHTGEEKDAEHPHPTGIFGLVAEGVTFTSVIDHGDRYASWGEETHPHKQLAAAFPAWKERHVIHDRRTPRVDERLDLGGGASLRFVAVNGNGVLEKAAKSKRFDHDRPSENDYSIAFVASLGAFELYSGGDLSGEDTRNHTGGRGAPKRHDVYDDVESTIASAVGNVEVLRVDHHGSPHSTNEAFVRALRPEVSIVSCGGGNSYHHPAIDVVDRLRPLGPVFVTSGLASDWKGRDDAPRVVGDILLTVSPDGATYELKDREGRELFRGRSFTDAEEAEGLDHAPAEASKPASPEAPKPGS